MSVLDESLSPLRVLQVHTRYLQPGGEDKAVDTEARLLRDSGHDVHTFVVDNPSGPVRTAGALALSSWNPIAARSVAAAVRRVRPDVVHVHNTWYALSPAVLGALRDEDVPVVMTLHNYRLLCANALLYRDGSACHECVTRGPHRALVHRCYRDSLVASTAAAVCIGVHRRRRTWVTDVDRYVVPTEFAATRFVRAGIPRDHIRVRFHTTSDPGRRSAPPSASRSVLFVGRLSEEKGADVLVDAWMRARPRGLELVVIGDGPMRASLEERAAGTVTFAGPLGAGDVASAMANARALVFPSVCYETQGMAMVEAMAAELPVVASALGGTREVLQDAAMALVMPGDADALGAALTTLTADRAVDEVGARSRRRWESTFSPAVGLSTLVDVYQDAVAGFVPRHSPVRLAAGSA